MKNKWKASAAGWGALVMTVVLAGCASGGKLHGPVGQFAELKPTQANEAVVVFLREEGTEGRVPLLLANDRVVGSLLVDADRNLIM